MDKNSFIQWLDDRLANDPDFDRRMDAALKQLRVERLAATIRAVRARNHPEPNAPDQTELEPNAPDRPSPDRGPGHFA